MIRPNWGNLQLAIKVKSFDVPEAEPFQALYSLGQFSDIGRSQSFAFDLSYYNRSATTQNLEFDYAKYLESATNYQTWNKGITEGLIPTEEELKLKEELLATGFRDWSKQDFNNFVTGNEKYGRKNFEQISQLVGKPQKEVEKYAEVFWARVD
jgi:hypothetical protein